jgi:transposase
MSYGYSSRIVQLNKKAKKSNLGVILGRLCIARGVEVAVVAARLGVSRMTIYNWFVGAHEPQAKHEDAINKLLSSFK